MLYLELLKEQLNNNREDFVSFAKTQGDDLDDYLQGLERLGKFSSREIEQKTSESNNVGAVPTFELDSRQNFSIEFKESWNNHEEARVWANEILENRTTFAADGSQLYAEKETSLPIGAIQVGWFENHHSKEKPYEKNAHFEILSPQFLLQNQEEPLNPETRVGEARFHAEAKKIEDFLIRKKGWQERGERMPLGFFDGTLLVSFSLPQTDLQKSFVQTMVNLVRHSRDVKVPLVGYVDRSFSRDLLNLIDAFEARETKKKQTLHDTTILSTETSKQKRILQNWGDRTCFCYSKRKGLEAFTSSDTGKSLVGFSYLQTTANSNPARLDVPGWVFEAGLVEEVFDVVRAECVIGLGYPYPLETADVTAVISNQDRQIFLRALQEFANREKLNFSVSRKGASKGRRR